MKSLGQAAPSELAESQEVEQNPFEKVPRHVRRREYMRAYQKNWAKTRRIAWLEANGPCRQCGSWERLEVDHVDPPQKTSHRIWSWSAERREAELKKCQALCHDCHEAKTARHNQAFKTARPSRPKKLTESLVLEIREMGKSGKWTRRDIAALFGVHHATVSKIINGKGWTWLKSEQCQLTLIQSAVPTPKGE